MYELGAPVLDPTKSFLERSFDLALDRVNLILRDPLPSLHLRVVETPWLDGRGRGPFSSATGGRNHHPWGRREVARPAAVDLQLAVSCGDVGPEARAVAGVEIVHGRGRRSEERGF